VLLRSLGERFLGVPLVLRIAAAASLVIGIGFPLSTLYGGMVYNGLQMSHAERWNTGTAWAVLAASPLMLITGFGIFLARPWVRPVLVVLPFLQYLPFQVVHWVFGAPNPVPSLAFYLVSGAAWAVGAVAYLFWYGPAKRFFQDERALGRTIE
jgi:hypothetical protein